MSSADNRRIRVPVGSVDLDTGTVASAESRSSPPSLTRRELDLLAYLVARSGLDVSREQLMQQVFGYSEAALSRAVDTTVHRLRTKIEVDASSPRCLLTVRGDGYRFVAVAGADRAHRHTLSCRLISLSTGCVDVQRLTFHQEGEDVAVTAQEVAILEQLARARGRVVETEQLLRHALGGGTRRALVNSMYRLRAKIEVNPAQPEILISVRGRGYRLVTVPEAQTSQTAPLVGRGDDLRRLRQYLASGMRLVSVLGTGGVGKTALVRWWAEGVLGQPPMFVELGDTRTSRTVHEQVAAALRLEVAPTDLSRALQDLAGRVLVLDGVDRAVQPVADLVQAWLSDCPRLRIVTTSRLRLGLPDEARLLLHPLSIAGPDSSAVDLLRKAAQRTAPELDLSAAHDPDLVAIAKATAGIPLALELAASRLGVLGPRHLRVRLDDALDLLVSRDPALPARHRAMRASLDVSWALLPAGARATLETLSVLAGDFSILDAEALVNSAELHLDLELLCERGLLSRRATGTAVIFRALPLVAAYAAERLADDASRLARAQQAYCEHIGRRMLCFPSDLAVTGALLASIRKWRAELSGLRNAVTWARAASSNITAVRCAIVASAVESRHGSPATAVALLRDATDLELDDDTLSAQLWLSLAWRERTLGNCDPTVPARAAAHAEASGQSELAAAALAEEAIQLAILARFAESQSRRDRAMALARSAGAARVQARLLLGEAFAWTVASTGPSPRNLCHRALALLDDQDDALLRSHALVVLSSLHRADGDLDGAIEHAERAMAELLPLELPSARIAAAASLGHLVSHRGDFERAEKILTDALKAARSSGRYDHLGALLLHLGGVAMLRGHHTESATWLEAATLEFERAGNPRGALSARAMGAVLCGRAGRNDDALERLLECFPWLDGVPESEVRPRLVRQVMPILADAVFEVWDQTRRGALGAR